MSRTMKLFERMINFRLHRECTISEYGVRTPPEWEGGPWQRPGLMPDGRRRILTNITYFVMNIV